MHRRRFFQLCAGAVAAVALQLDPPREPEVNDYAFTIRHGRTKRTAKMEAFLSGPGLTGDMEVTGYEDEPRFAYVGWVKAGGMRAVPSQPSVASLPAA